MRNCQRRRKARTPERAGPSAPVNIMDQCRPENFCDPHGGKYRERYAGLSRRPTGEEIRRPALIPKATSFSQRCSAVPDGCCRVSGRRVSCARPGKRIRLGVIFVTPLIVTYVMAGRSSVVTKLIFLLIAIPGFLITHVGGSVDVARRAGFRG